VEGRDEIIRASGLTMNGTHVAAPVRGVSTPAAGERPARSYAAMGLFALAAVALGTPLAIAAASHKHAPTQARKAAKAEHQGKAGHHANTEHHKGGRSARETKRSAGARPSGRTTERKSAHAVPLPINRPAAADTAVTLPPDLAATKQAIELVRQGKLGEATAWAATAGNPLAQKIVEWALLRRSDTEAGLERYAAFIRANPDWPSIPLIRRRAEEKLWQTRPNAGTVRRFVGDDPTSTTGRLALARVEMEEGNRAAAESKVRAAWRSAPLSAEMEAVLPAAFPGVLTRADHVARMDRRIGAKDFSAAMRAAKRIGDDHVAIVKACSAAETKSAKGGKLLDEVSGDVRGDLGYALCRLHWLMRNDSPGSNVNGRIVTPKADIAAAVKLVLAASPEDLQRQDTDEWWRERRMLARKLIDLGEARTAYRVVHEAAPPANPYYRADFHFMAGWIALRFLADPATALEHFAEVDQSSTDPVVRARAAYWRGRAAEAAGKSDEMRAHYEAAARFPTAYYGQLARARLGLGEIAPLRSPPEPAPGEATELVRAADMLYAIGETDLVRSFMTDLAQESNDDALLAALGQLTARRNDAQSMLLMGKTALARDLALDHYAFPDIGVPAYSPVGSKLDRCIVYSVVRTESAFDQRDKSSANAVGLMQVTPGAGRDTAKRFGVSYDWNRLVSDPAYNTQMGAAELAGLLTDYRGSYVMTFAGYNAGRGRVQQWVAQHGDPRDPKVDAVDWVERIPFSETRNYVQRVMENLQVYRARFGASTATVEPNLHRTATIEPRFEPASVR
jgi:soluble lytic murein transglycosylase